MSRYKKKKTVLVLYAPIGSGHASAADAIKEQFLKYQDVDFIMADIFDFVPSLFCKSLLKSYMELLHYMPAGYDFLYRWGDMNSSLFLRNIVNKIFYNGMKDFLDKYSPDAVIATHVTPAGIIAKYKKNVKKDIALLGVVTDYAMHKWWVYDEIDCYIVPDEKMFTEYKAKLKTNQKVYDLGIPVHENFSKNRPVKNDLREEFGIEKDAFVCLMTGGGEGLLPMPDIVKAWEKHADNNEKNVFIAVCGRNKELADKLRRFGFSWLKVVEYTYDISRYMRAADLMVSKAGGVSATEAMVVGIPLVIYKPLPGQEYINAKNLADSSLAIEAKKAEDVCGIVLAAKKNIFKKIEDIKAAQRQLVKKDAAFAIMEKTYEYINL